MKKIILLLLLLLFNTAFSQDDLKDSENLSKMATLVKENQYNFSKLDSISIEVEFMKNKTKNVLISRAADEFLDVLKGLKSNSTAYKSLKKNLIDFPNEYLSSFKIKEDKFKNEKVITEKSAYNSRYKVYPYIIIKDGKASMFLRITYTGRDWVFFNKAIFLIKNKNYEINDLNTNNNVQNGGVVSEISDVLVNDEIRKILDFIAISDVRIDYRLQGKYSYDSKLTYAEIESIKKTVYLYLQLTQ